MVTTVSVLPLNSQVLPGHNQETYQRLQDAVVSTPPPQIWLATCDDLPLQRQLAATLAESLQRQGAIAAPPHLFEIDQPNLVQQLQTCLPPPAEWPPLLQILGIEQLTYCSSDTQYQFLRSLHQLWPWWRSLEVNLLLWVPRPWLKQIRREVPQLAQSVFEFMGEPTPISTVPYPAAYPATFSPVRRWQFLGKPAPEVPAASGAPSTVADPGPPAATVVPVVPAVPGDPDLTPPDAIADTPLPTFSDALWEQLQADLGELETASEPSEAVPTAESAPAESPATSPDSAPPAPAARLTDIADTLLATSARDMAPAADDRSPVPAAEAPTPDWAIAWAWRDRIQAGDHRPETLAAAIQAYEHLQPHQATTPQRTETLNDLGSLYWLWAQQAQTPEDYWQRLTQSGEIYEAALTPVSPHTEAGVLNRLHSNLGSVYSLLAAHQNPPHFLGKAVRAFHRALQYVSIEVMPEEYATLQTHLGTTYWSLAQHTQEAAHLHRAIAAYQEALRQSQPQQAPQAYAQLQNNLGIALWSLSRHERPNFLLEQAIAAYRTALAYRTPDADPVSHAATQNNLGTAYWDLGGHCEERSPAQQQAWQQAIAAYAAALTTVESCPAEELSFDLWATHHSIGVVYDQLAIALAPDTSAQEPLLLQATPHYVQALTGWQTIDAATTETAFQALVRNLQLQARYLGVEVQQRSLSQVPADWLPEIWRKL